MMKKNIFAGLGLGLLIGTIIGLSIAQVTGIILGALTSLLAAFFGLRSNKDGEIGNQIIIGTFSISCLLSIFFGLYIRTHNLLSPSLSSEIKEYKNAYFDTAEIKKIILFKELGLIPDGYNFSKEKKQTNRQTALMAGNQGVIDLCNAVDDNSTLKDVKEAFDESGGKYSEIEKRLTLAIADSTELRNTLLFFKKLICEK
jgi:hypothetical protein